MANRTNDLRSNVEAIDMTEPSKGQTWQSVHNSNKYILTRVNKLGEGMFVIAGKYLAGEQRYAQPEILLDLADIRLYEEPSTQVERPSKIVDGDPFDKQTENYQVRLTSGEIRWFKTLSEVSHYMKDHFIDCEKISFNGPDGTRIRLVCRLGSTGRFNITFWSDERYSDLGWTR